uniref:Uncharacterized protein n=1 Tax=Arundo donax TaxID=35708 RepID=A0A0A8YZ36_ARUDO
METTKTLNKGQVPSTFSLLLTSTLRETELRST